MCTAKLKLSEYQEVHLVDGGEEASTATELFPKIEHKLISIRNGDLMKVPVPPHGKGVTYSEGIDPSMWSDRSYVPRMSKS